MRKCAYASVVASVLLACAYGCSKGKAPADPETTGAKAEQASLRSIAPGLDRPARARALGTSRRRGGT